MAYSIAEVQAKIAELQAQPYQVGYENAWTNLFWEVQRGGGAGWLVQQAHMQAKNQFWANQPAGSRQAGGVVWAPDPDNPGEYINVGSGVGGGAGVGIGDGSGASGDNTTPEGGWDTIKLIYGWLPDAALRVFFDQYVESGNADAAWASIRQNSEYEGWFPGNLTEDGRVRFNEADYAKEIAAYDEVFTNVGLNPEVFRGRYGELIRGDVTSYELETMRVNPMYDRIASQSQQLRSWYAENYGIDLTTEALLGAALDPELGERVLNKQISISEIGGEGAESGYDISLEMAEMMLDKSADLDRAGAEKLFQSAESLLPALSVLAERHADPDDEFDINEFIQADVFRDPGQLRRINRLFAQERSTFTGGSETDYLRSQKTGGVAGLGRS